MTYSDAVAYLESLIDFEKLGFRRHFADTVSLDTIRALLGLLGNPQHGLPCVHIAGTKGKGSVAVMVESVLGAAHLRTGLFTSPHLVSFRERIRVAGAMVSEEEIAWAVERVREPIEKLRDEGKLNPSTFFEAYLAMALVLFRQWQVEMAVLETGLGGRLDATNTCEPLACAITTLGLDHTEILGNTIEQIAREKAGILKSGVPAVYAPQEPAAEAILQAVAQAAGAPLRRAPEVLAVETSGKPPVTQVTVRMAGGPLTMELPLFGEHQVANLSVALGLVELLRERGYEISDEAIQRGVREVKWPGRLQIVGRWPWVVLDGAHNEPSAEALVRALPQMVDYRRLIAVIGLASDKDVRTFCEILAPLVDVAVLTRARLTRAMPAAELARVSEGLWRQSRVTASVPEALAVARAEANEDDCIVVTGSLMVVGEAMEDMGLSI